MISPSDTTAHDASHEIPGTLFRESLRTGSVLPLEFKAIDHPLRRRSDWMVGNDENVDASDSSLQEELAKLEARIRAQAQQLPAQLDEARIAAKAEARLEWNVEMAQGITEERGRVTATCAEFAKAKTNYFVSVEEEVVRLSLAIAARVLNREAKLDPLLLGAVVRMALEKVAEDSGTVLHVPAAEAEAWRAMFADENQPAVTVMGEERMEPTECTLETTMGRVELGVMAQLEEIEKGFFDLLLQRPT